MVNLTPRAACVVGQFGDPETAASGARVTSLAEGLAGHGYEVITIGVTSTWSGRHPPESRGLVIRMQETGIGTSSLIIVQPADGTTIARRWRTSCRHLRALRAFTYGVVSWGRANRGGTFVLYGHRGELLLIGVLAARFSRCQTVLDVTEWFDRASRASFAGWASTLIAQRVVPRLVDHVTIISDEVLRELPHSESVIVVPAMAPRRVTERAARAPGTPERVSSAETFICVFTGSEQRGLASLVRALEGLAASHPRTQFVLKISGPRHSTESLSPTGRLWVEHSGLLSREGYFALLEGADCLVIPGSRGSVKDYAFPNRLPEYLLSGVPTIISGYPAAARTVMHGEHAIVMDTADVAELKRGLESVLLAPDEMRQMAQRGRSHALVAFDPLLTVAPLVEALEGGQR